MTNYRAGFVGIIGMPNAGKSTLLNRLIGEHLSIVTAKPQTTRTSIQGIWSEDEGQIIFTDSPGLVSAKGGLNKYLRAELERVVEDSDALLVVVSLDEKKRDHVDKILNMAIESGKPVAAVINKCDIEKLRKRIAYIQPLFEDQNWKFIEVSKDMPLADLKTPLWDMLIELLPESQAPLYDVELFTDSNLREILREYIREQVFLNITQEVPYQTAVRIRSFDEDRDVPAIQADILVGKDSQKAMVIGKGGSVIKTIGSRARAKFEQIYGQKVFLKLNVVVRQDWMDNKGLMKDLGYVVEK
jgi:GTP-binding protein Era